MEKEFNCHDCNKSLKVENQEILNGKVLIYDNQGEKIQIMKCNECYDKDKSLSNFQECEVYSRIVGYIRPVKQWNVGKQQEYQERKKYDQAKTNL